MEEWEVSRLCLVAERAPVTDDTDYEPILASGATEWVLAAPFRAHVRHVGEVTGMPWRVLALVAGVQPALMRSLLFGRQGRQVRRLHIVTARLLLALDATTLRLLGGRRCRAEHTRGRIRDLLGDLDADELAAMTRCSTSELTALAEGDQTTCNAITALLVHAVWDAHRCGFASDVAA